MASKRPAFIKSRKAPSDTEGTFELNIAPIMNMFIILIPYLMSMAVFTHIAILEFNLPPNAGAGLDASMGNPIIKLTVVLEKNDIKITSGETLLDSLPNSTAGYDVEGLTRQLGVHRATHAVKDEIIVATADVVPLKHLVTVMDVCRQTGFAHIGLSSAVEEQTN